MNLFDLYDNPEDLHRHDDADLLVADAFWDKYKHKPNELEKREDAIAKSSLYSFYYAKYILKSAFKLGEPEIAKRCGYSYLYASDVLKGRFELGEQAIARDAQHSHLYARDVLKSPS
jgi:hypothetical protein